MEGGCQELGAWRTGVTADRCGVSLWGDSYGDDGLVSILKSLNCAL